MTDSPAIPGDPARATPPVEPSQQERLHHAYLSRLLKINAVTSPLLQTPLLLQHVEDRMAYDKRRARA